ncbi:ribonuclease E/G [Hyphococcus sp.]|uniref:ribonuclease E/G n=1 Tax=Hyphococcus sp. TaxID=2038636 RepID=UPI003CCBA273
MKRRVIIECGVAETRGALLVDDVVWKFWFGPACGDETTDEFPLPGRCFAGQIKAVNRTLNGVFVDIGNGRDAFLPLQQANQSLLVEGAFIHAEVKSPPRQTKGAILRLLGASKQNARPGRIAPFTNAALEAAEALGALDADILVDDGASARLLKKAGFQHVAHESRPVSLFIDNGVEQDYSSLSYPETTLPGGGRIIIDETQALTAIDVDTAGLSASSPARLREKIGVAAAKEAIRQVSLRNIGGHIVIDFPPLKGETQRRRFQEQLKTELNALDGAGAASFSRSGLFSFTMPRSMPSLLERFTEAATVDPVSGRRFTVETCAKAAIRALENRLRVDSGVKLKVDMGAAVAEFIDLHSTWRARLAERYGERFHFMMKDNLEERAFDLTEQ